MWIVKLEFPKNKLFYKIHTFNIWKTFFAP